jgi:hypothetical protein
MEISRHNRDSLFKDAQNENVFFALGSKKPKQQIVEEVEDEDEEYPKVGKGKRGHHRNQISSS